MDAADKESQETFSREQTESEICENYLAKVNDLQNEVDFLINLLRKYKIPIPVSYGQKQHGQADPLLEANKVIEDQRLRITELEGMINSQDVWLYDFNQNLLELVKRNIELVKQIEKL